MTLTPAQEALLALPFRPDEHGFNGSNNVYLLKSAIRRRLSLVDPGWSQSVPVVVDRTANTVQLGASITICGSTRSATGVAIINRWKKDAQDKRIEMEGYDLALAELKAQKNADSDLLPRIAVIGFNVGAYLRVEAAKKIKTPEALADFLSKLPAPPSSHWSTTGGRERIAALMKKLNLKWEDIKDLIEPGRTLSGLSDTSLDEAQFTARIAELAFKSAAPSIVKVEEDEEPHLEMVVTPTSTRFAPGTNHYANPHMRPPATDAGIYCDAAHLAAEDIVAFSSPGYGSEKIPVVVTIVSIKASQQGYAATVKYADTGVTKPHQFGVLAMHRVVGGPKLLAAKDEPSLIEMQNGQRTWVGKPATPKPIAYLNCDLQFLAVDDVLDHSSKGGNGMRRCHERIVTIGEQQGGTRTVTLSNIETCAERTVDLTSTGNHTIVGGPKLVAVNANPALAPVKGAHRVWIGEEVAVS